MYRPIAPAGDLTARSSKLYAPITGVMRCDGPIVQAQAGSTRISSLKPGALRHSSSLLGLAAPRRPVRCPPARALETDVKPELKVVSSAPVEEEEEDRPFDSLSGKKKNEVAWLAVYAGVITGMSALAYSQYPKLTQYIVDTWKISSTGNDSVLPVFLSLVSILYALIASNTFLFCYERQTSIMQELYTETYSLEMILLKVFTFENSTQETRILMAESIKRYIVEEMYNPEEMESPYVCEGAYMEIMDKIRGAEMQGNTVDSIMEEMGRLARAQSRRSSVSAGLLPNVHWIFIHAMELTFTVTFLIMGASSPESGEQTRLAFTVLLGLLTLTGLVLHDLALVSDGLYCFRGPLDERLNYVQRLLRWLTEKPADYVPPRVASMQYLQEKMKVAGVSMKDEVDVHAQKRTLKGHAHS